MTKKRCVITGIGAVTPAGTGWEKVWQAVLNGRSGIGPISSFPTEGYRTTIAGEVIDFDARKFMDEKLMDDSERFVQFAVGASRMAIEQSGLNPRPGNPDIGVVVGCGMGGLPYFEIQARQFVEKGPGSIRPGSITRIMPNAASARIAYFWKIRGPNFTISTACSAGNHAVGAALDLIRSGRCKAVICGGAESLLSPFTFGAFDSLRVMSSRNATPMAACRPFDKSRDGFVLGEGAVMFVLEEQTQARARSAPVFAEVAGYGSSNGVYNILAPEPDGLEASQSMEAALRDADLKPEDVDYIHAHGTGTRSNDAAETEAIHRTFGEHAKRICVNSTKPITGHMLGAAGAMGVLVCALSIRTQMVAPTLNYETPDPECDLEYVHGNPRKMSIRVAMGNAFAFGNNNATIIVKREE
jgi:3-oxoacyl-[acyl-carrier-protein] synthase II